MNSNDSITAAELVTCAIALFGKKDLLDPKKRKAALSTAREIMTAANCVNEEAAIHVAASSADFRFQEEKSQSENELKNYISIEEFWKNHTSYKRKEDAERLLKDFALSKHTIQVAAKDATRSLAEQKDVYETTPAHEQEKQTSETLHAWKAKGFNIGYIPMILAFKRARFKAGRAKGAKNRVKRTG